MRRLLFIVGLAWLGLAAMATTLEKLTLEDLALKSTAVVRGRASAAGTVVRGPMIYTVYRLQVAETLKGSLPAGAEILVPGGTYGRYRQAVAGAPVLEPGVDYVLFLWTSPRGIIQVIGLSQGVFQVRESSTGTLLVRGRIEAEFVDSQGRATADTGMRLTLGELRELLRRTQAGRVGP